MTSPLEQKSIVEVKRLVENRVDLPVMPKVANVVMAEVTSEKSNAARLAQIISSDEGLAGRIMRVANSAFYRGPLPTTTLQQAIVRLGRNLVRDLVISLSSQSLFRSMGELEEQLWCHAIATGIAARLVAEQTRGVDRDEAFIGGLMHDIGKAVLNGAFPERFQETVDQAAKEGIPSWQAEQEAFGCHHAAVGGVLLMQWELPQGLANAVLWHHSLDDPSKIPANSRDLAIVLGGANELVNALGINAVQQVIELTDESVLRGPLHISDKAIEELSERVQAFYEEERNLFT